MTERRKPKFLRPPEERGTITDEELRHLFGGLYEEDDDPIPDPKPIPNQEVLNDLNDLANAIPDMTYVELKALAIEDGLWEDGMSKTRLLDVYDDEINRLRKKITG